MAEGFARRIVPGAPIYSAGTAPKGIHPMATRVMKEAGIDITPHKSKGLEAIPLDRVDLVITLCSEAAENASVAASIERVHWPLPDPALARGDEEQVLRFFRRVRDDIHARVRELFARPAAE